jgi:hypothetical protein
MGLALVLAVLWVSPPAAERMGYPPGEFAARRQRLAEAVGSGTILLFGATEAAPGLRFRQDHDFYYLTGNESLNAALVIDAATGAATLFLPKLSEAQIRYEGANWLEDPAAARSIHTSMASPPRERSTSTSTSIIPFARPPSSVRTERSTSPMVTIWTRSDPMDPSSGPSIRRRTTAFRLRFRQRAPFTWGHGSPTGCTR